MKAFQKVGGVGYLVQFFVAAIVSGVFVFGTAGIAELASKTSSATTTTSASTISPLGLSLTFILGLMVPGVPLVMSSLGWLLAGRESHRGLFTATGIVGLVSAAMVLVGFAALLFTLPFAESLDSSSALAGLVLFGALGGLGTILVFVFVILTVFSLLQAEKVYQVKELRYAGIGMAISIVLAIAGAVVIGASLLFLISPSTASSSTELAAFSSTFFVEEAVGFLLFLVPLALTSLFAGLGFLRAQVPVPETSPTPPIADASLTSPPTASPFEAPRPGVRKYMALAAIVAVTLLVGTVSSAAFIPGATSSVSTTQQTSIASEVAATTTVSSTSCPPADVPDIANPIGPFSVGSPGLNHTTFIPFGSLGDGEADVAGSLGIASTSRVTASLNSTQGVEVMIFCAPAAGPQDYTPPISGPLTGYVFSTGPGIDVRMTVTLPPGSYEMFIFDPSTSDSTITLTQGVSITA